MAGNTVNVLIKADDQASKEIDNVSGSVQRMGEVAGGFLAANAIQSGIGKLSSAIGDSIEGFKQQQQVTAQTEAVIRSTGGVAGVSADQILAMADSLKKNSLFADDAIQSGENLLLTFTGIGKDAFPRATETMVDMSQALGQDLPSSAIQLGKALNDPIQGVTALRRVGVSFTDAQLEQIKTMQESGDLMGAQTVILDELAREFGGSAQAASDAAGGTADYADGLDDLQDAIGARLFPVMSAFQGVLGTLAGFFAQHMELLAAVAAVIAGPLVAAFVALGIAATAAAIPIIVAAAPILAIGVAIGLLVAAIVLLITHWDEVTGAAQRFIEQHKVLAAILLLPIAPIVAVIAAGVLLIQHWREVIDVAKAVADTVVGAFTDLKDKVTGIVTAFGEWLIGHWQEIVTGILGVIFPPGAGLFLIITHWQEIKDQVGAIVDAIRDWVVNAFDTIRDTVGAAADATRDWVVNAWNTLRDGVGAAADAARDWVVDTFNGLKDGVIGSTNDLKDGVVGAWNAVSDAIGGVVDGIVSRVTGAFSGMASTVAGIVNSVVDRVNGVIGAINSALSFNVSIPGVDMPGPIPDIPGVTISGPGPVIPTIPHMARGGIVNRPTLALIGEAGPEAVVPLSGRHGVGTTINITIHAAGSIYAERDIVRIIRNELLNGGFNNFGLAT